MEKSELVGKTLYSCNQVLGTITEVADSDDGINWTAIVYKVTSQYGTPKTRTKYLLMTYANLVYLKDGNRAYSINGTVCNIE